MFFKIKKKIIPNTRVNFSIRYKKRVESCSTSDHYESIEYNNATNSYVSPDRFARSSMVFDRCCDMFRHFRQGGKKNAKQP